MGENSTNFEEKLRQSPNKIPQLSEVFFHPILGSTNVEAVDRARTGAASGTLVVADAQSSGRGRLGRHWDSPAGKGLYFSLVLRPELPPTRAPMTTLAAGLGLAMALRRLSVTNLILKWPNDLMVSKRKLGGILTELYLSGSKVDFLVVGVGINVSQDASDFNPEVATLAISLRQILGENKDRADLLDQLLPPLLEEMGKLVHEGPAQLVTRWERDSGMIGQTIAYEENGRQDQGRVLGLAPDGRLRVQKNDHSVSELLAEDTTLL